ncbi:MAG TPA: methyltransferase domain-containing protein [Clostridia bacterium]|nr:methyltransferase domain-containing protein [Clostridia bacterium]
MSFYERIAPYYDEIFPVGEEQLGFIRQTAGKPPKRLLDVACGSGTYTVRLAREGYEMWACDIDHKMTELAESRATEHGYRVNVFISDMLELNRNVSSVFDCVFCIGNSIVHLGSADKIGEAVIQMKNLLGPGGKLILQIINFDRVIEKGVTNLPTITNAEKKLEFKRNYTLDQSTGLIHFDTVLTVEENDRTTQLENRVDLYPLKALTLQELLEKAGLRDISFYGGFNGETYVRDESFLLVALAAV